MFCQNPLGARWRRVPLVVVRCLVMDLLAEFIILDPLIGTIVSSRSGDRVDWSRRAKISL